MSIFVDPNGHTVEKQLAKARNENNEQIIADQAALIRELVLVLTGAQEELRLLRMKDTGSVYNPTIRARIDIALSRVPKEYRG